MGCADLPGGSLRKNSSAMRQGLTRPEAQAWLPSGPRCENRAEFFPTLVTHKRNLRNLLFWSYAAAKAFADHSFEPEQEKECRKIV